MADATDVVMECTCCEDETTLTTGTQLQSHEGSVAEERDDVLPLPFRACVNSEERSVDFKKWRELIDTVITIDYRCIRCRAYRTIGMLTKLRR